MTTTKDEGRKTKDFRRSSFVFRRLPNRWRSHALVLATFLVLALALSYPLPLRFTTHTPGSATWAFDEATFLWNIWYFKHALLDLGTSPLHSELIWYPLGIDLILHTYNFFNALVALPLQLAWGLVPASNVTLILATVLSGYGTYLLVRQLLADGRHLPPDLAGHLAPLVAGLIYAFGSNRAIYAALGHYDMVTTGCIPFYALYLVRTLHSNGRLHRSGWRDAALAGLFFALAALAEMIFAVFLAILTVVFVIFHVSRFTFHASHFTPLVPRLAFIALVAALIWSPVLVPIVREFVSGDYALEGWGEGLKLSTDLLGFITPTTLHPVWGSDWTRALRAVEEGTARFSDVNTVFVGWVTLALAVIGALATGRRGRVWCWTALLFGLFCLGPLLQINGRYEFSLDRLLGDRGVTFPMPFALLHYIPFVKANRAPNRNSVVLMLGVAALAGYAVAWITMSMLRAAPRGVKIVGQVGGGDHSTTSLNQPSPTVGQSDSEPVPSADSACPVARHRGQALWPGTGSTPPPTCHSLGMTQARAFSGQLAMPGAAPRRMPVPCAPVPGHRTGWPQDRLAVRPGKRAPEARPRAVQTARGRALERAGPFSGQLLGAHAGNILAVVLAVAILFEHAAVPLPLTDARVPPIYERIAAEPGQFSILQLPLGWRNSFGVFGSERTQVQLYQTAHGKPMLGGNISRAPDFKMGYFRRLPLFQAITETEFGRSVPPEVDAAARAQAADLMVLYDVRYLIVLPPIPGRFPYADTYAATRDYALDLLPVEPQPFYDQDGVQAYRVRQPAGRADFELDLGMESSAAYRGEGWHDDEQIFGATANWAGARQARLFLPMRVESPAPAYRLSLRIRPFTLTGTSAYPGAPPQTLQAFVNGRSLGGPITLAEDWTILQFSVPPGVVRSGLNRVILAFGRTARPRDVLPADVRIGQTGVDAPVDIEINAAADFAYVTLEDDAGERVDASAGRRGYNVALVDPRSGRLLEKRGFDTAANVYEAGRLAQFINDAPAGVIVIAATRGPATAHLTDQAWAALRTVGAGQPVLWPACPVARHRGTGDPRAVPDASHALIGVKGAPPGSAAEVVQAGGAYLRIGRNSDRRSLAAAVDWIRLEP